MRKVVEYLERITVTCHSDDRLQAMREVVEAGYTIVKHGSFSVNNITIDPSRFRVIGERPIEVRDRGPRRRSK